MACQNKECCKYCERCSCPDRTQEGVNVNDKDNGDDN